MNENLTRNKNNETLTKAKCDKGFSGDSSFLPRSNYSVGGQESPNWEFLDENIQEQLPITALSFVLKNHNLAHFTRLNLKIFELSSRQ